MRQKSILFQINSSFIALMFIVFSYPSLAQADTANPPKIQSMKMLNTEKIYKVGDVVTFSIKYSGGNPGLKRVGLSAYDYIQGNYSTGCLYGESWYSLWGDKPSNYGLPIGPISTTEILMYKYVSANCIKGVNEVRLAATIVDLTDLETREVLSDGFFKFSVLDGLWIPPGEVLGNPIDSTFSLDFLPSEIVLEQGKSFYLKVPSRTSEGVPASYQPWPRDVCFISQEPAFPWYQPIVEWFTVIEFKKSGICSISANGTLKRSNIKEFVFKKEIKVVTQLELAEAKAAAELKAKAAAELKAKQDAEAKAIADKAAEANRREQTISVSPFISGPIPLSASGLLIKVSSTSNLSVFAYNSTDNVCEFANGLIKTKTSGRCVIAFSQEGNSEFKPATNFILDFSIVSAAKTTTITCVKGKLTKKVTAVKPKCPSGYKVKK